MSASSWFCGRASAKYLTVCQPMREGAKEMSRLTLLMKSAKSSLFRKLRAAMGRRRSVKASCRMKSVMRTSPPPMRTTPSMFSISQPLFSRRSMCGTLPVMMPSLIRRLLAWMFATMSRSSQLMPMPWCGARSVSKLRIVKWKFPISTLWTSSSGSPACSSCGSTCRIRSMLDFHRSPGSVTKLNAPSSSLTRETSSPERDSRPRRVKVA